MGHKFFLSRNATVLPYLEVYRGAVLMEASTVPPSSLEQFSISLGRAFELVEREVAARFRRERAKLRALRLQLRESEQRTNSAAAVPTGRSSRRRGGCFEQEFAASMLEQRSQPRRPPRRGAPLRGATGA